ncbi:MAG: tryptophan-rich sensory protein [Candidatus Zixiibacteriota bacterium]|nr:MAG: tryptophan-rich sensory protein [candidate division Zixibacteria bacterium]
MRSGQQIISLIIWIGICFIPAVTGSQFTPGEWYARLAKPAWTPPGYLFGPVWTSLYTMMEIAAWLLWKGVGLSGAKIAFILFFGQLILNGMWSWLFFGMHKPGLAFIELCLLWILILATLIAFWKLYQPSGILLIPCTIWVSFATILNFSIWFLNKSN